MIYLFSPSFWIGIFFLQILNFFHWSALIRTTYYEKSCPNCKHVEIALKCRGPWSMLRANKRGDRFRCVTFQSEELLQHFRGPIYQRLIHLQLLLLLGFSSNIFGLAKSQFYATYFFQLSCTSSIFSVQMMSYYNLQFEKQVLTIVNSLFCYGSMMINNSIFHSG